MPLSKVIIHDVNRHNFSELWPAIIKAIHSCDFFALDLEFSGLGDIKKKTKVSMNERYAVLTEVAKTRSIVSIGLSTFSYSNRGDSVSDTKGLPFNVQVYEFLTLCSDSYIVDPKASLFLLEQGFDFNKHVCQGIPHYKGNDRDAEDETISLRNFFIELIKTKKPIVLHNGLMDLIFLYQSFYTDLPQMSQTFVSDLAELFVNGIYDTKYIAEYHLRIPATYLLFVFRSSQRENSEDLALGKDHIKIEFVTNTLNPKTIKSIDIKYIQNHTVVKKSSVCLIYGLHGTCKEGKLCRKSHEIDDVIDYLDTKKRKNKSKSSQPAKELKIEGDTTKGHSLNHSAHNAGMDSFMTGFIFGRYLLSRLGDVADKGPIDLKDVKNRIYLMGKDTPLIVLGSNFCQPSAGHVKKYERIMS